MSRTLTNNTQTMHKKEEKNPVKIEKQNPQQGGTGIKGLKGW